MSAETKVAVEKYGGIPQSSRYCLCCLLNSAFVCLSVCLFRQAANPQVRANATGLLMDVFPLQNPDAGNEEVDALLQKQFDIFEVKSIAPWLVARAPEANNRSAKHRPSASLGLSSRGLCPRYL